ncbi:MAG: phosphatase PAP2 family protein [Chloroflexi bacterium]|nr:phosphatase PAP2 family protein [Chloroflexota bacterium]
MKTKDLLVRILRNRLALFAILLIIQSLFFVTNMANSLLREPDDGWELKIAAIDNHLSPMGIWLIPYAVGFLLAALLPLWAAFYMPIKLYRQFILAMGVAAVFSYIIYIVFPTYVVKPRPEDVPGSDILSVLLRTAYEADNAYSTHNAAPSQHVFYAIINACFMIRFRPRPRVFWVWTTLAALISASALLTRQHHSPDLIAGYLTAAGAYYAGLWLGERVTAWLGDEHSPLIAPWQRRLRWRRGVMDAA